MQHESVKSLRRTRRTGRLKRGRPSQLPGALAARREDVNHRERAAGASLLAVLRRRNDGARPHFLATGVQRVQEPVYRAQRADVARIDQRNLDAQLARQARAPDRSVASVQFVGHREYDQRRNSHRQHGFGDHQVRLQACRVQHQNDRVGLPAALEFAQKHVARDHLVETARGQTMDAREIDQFHRPGRYTRDAGPAFHGDAGIVRHPLAKTREVVE